MRLLSRDEEQTVRAALSWCDAFPRHSHDLDVASIEPTIETLLALYLTDHVARDSEGNYHHLDAILELCIKHLRTSAPHISLRLRRALDAKAT